jgi:predicted acylesterase/phospholipase RssA
VKALFEHRMLPRVMAGSSVGSIVAGIVATRTDDELRETFRWGRTLLSGATALSMSALNILASGVRMCAGVMPCWVTRSGNSPLVCRLVSGS